MAGLTLAPRDLATTGAQLKLLQATVQPNDFHARAPLLPARTVEAIRA
jgi:hypothetical protein